MIDYGLKDKVVIITGANNPQGIGAINGNGFTKIIRTDYGHVLMSEDKLFMVENLWQQMKTVDTD